MVKVHTSLGPSSATRKQVILSTFKGVDLTSGAANVDPTRSPDAPNMIPDANGFPAKRTGYDRVAAYPGKVYGLYRYKGPGQAKPVYVVHAGKGLYILGKEKPFCAEMNEAESRAVQHGEKLWVTDGKTYRYIAFSGEGKAQTATTAPASSIATVPVITIGKAPAKNGRATSYNPYNLLTDKCEERFTVGEEDAAAKDFYLSSANIQAVNEVKILDGAGAWQTTTAYTVNREEGKVTFSAPPGKSPVTGEDNVAITYTREATRNAEIINKMRLSVLYGVNGSMDRVFLSGNPEVSNQDYWSQFDDPAYFGDDMYSVLGTAASPIMGYSLLGGFLVTHKQGEENDRNAFVRAGSIAEDGDAEFLIKNVIQGQGAVSLSGYASMDSEPAFLTKEGVFALTASDMTGERYQQERSFYIREALRGQDLTAAQLCRWKNFLTVSTPAGLYLLDGGQKSYENRAGSSRYQYECYHWPGVPAASLFCLQEEAGDALYFGDEKGNLFKLLESTTKAGSYKDWAGVDENGQNVYKAIKARWATPYLPLGVYGRKKNIEDVWVNAQPYGKSGGEISYMSDTDFDYHAKSWASSVFDWADVSFASFDFNTLARPVTVRCGRRRYGVELFGVAVQNEEIESPFGIYAIQIDFTVSGKTKV